MSGSNPSHAVHNERLKLRANALDRASTAFLAIGVLTPSISADAVSQPFVRLIAFACLAVVLHIAANWLLRGLRA
jgi:hypothetical protein